MKVDAQEYGVRREAGKVAEWKRMRCKGKVKCVNREFTVCKVVGKGMGMWLFKDCK